MAARSIIVLLLFAAPLWAEPPKSRKQLLKEKQSQKIGATGRTYKAGSQKATPTKPKDTITLPLQVGSEGTFDDLEVRCTDVIDKTHLSLTIEQWSSGNHWVQPSQHSHAVMVGGPPKRTARETVVATVPERWTENIVTDKLLVFTSDGPITDGPSGRLAKWRVSGTTQVGSKRVFTLEVAR